MTSKLPSGQSLFTMSALNGLLAIRRYTREHPGILLQEVIDALKHVTADDAYHDYHAALLIEGLLKETPSIDDIPSFFGNVLSVMIREVHPWWSRLATYGRERVRQ